MRLAIISLLAAASVAHLSMALAEQEPAAPQAAPAAATKTPSTPASEQQAASTASPASASTTASATPDAPKSTTAPANGATKLSLTAGDDDAASELRQLKAHGYKAEAHGDEIWFCRKEVLMGSRFDKKVCFTPDQLKHIEADARQQTDRIQRRISGDPRSPLP